MTEQVIPHRVVGGEFAGETRDAIPGRDHWLLNNLHRTVWGRTGSFEPDAGLIVADYRSVSRETGDAVEWILVPQAWSAEDNARGLESKAP